VGVIKMATGKVVDMARRCLPEVHLRAREDQFPLLGLCRPAICGFPPSLSIERTVHNNINNNNNCNNETVTSTGDIKWRLALFQSASPYSYDNLVITYWS